jgi:hypothetical protein
MVDAMQPIHDVRHIVDRGLLLVGENPKNRSQGRRSHLRYTILVDVIPVVSRVHVVLSNRKMGGLSSVRKTFLSRHHLSFHHAI